MWGMLNGRQDEIRNSYMKDTKPTFMHSLLGKNKL